MKEMKLTYFTNSSSDLTRKSFLSNMYIVMRMSVLGGAFSKYELCDDLMCGVWF